MDGTARPAERAEVEARLRRMEELVCDLDSVTDAAAREGARRLLESVLDFHGLALARMLALAYRESAGASLMELFREDAQVCAALLLHGLHPDELETRVRRAAEDMDQAMRRRGVTVALVGVASGRAALAVRSVAGAGRPSADLRRDIESRLFEAAPDLESIDIDFVEDFGMPVHISRIGEGAC